MLASYNSETKSIEWLTGLKNHLPQITAEVQLALNNLANFGDISNLSSKQLTELGERLGTTDKTFQAFLETTQKSGTVYKTSEDALAGYQTYLKSTNKVLDLSAIKTTALSVAMKAISTVGWMVAITAATWALGKGIGYIDDWIHRVEKANEAMEGAISEYETTTSNLENINEELDKQNQKIDELQSKDKLTYAEKGELEELQAITKELLLQQDIEEKRAEKASKEVADKTINAYDKQYGKHDISENDLNDKLDYTKATGAFPVSDDENDITGNIAALLRAKELLNEAEQKFSNAVKTGSETQLLEDDVQYYIDMVDGLSGRLNESISDLEEKRIALEEQYNKVINKQNSGSTSFTTSEQDTLSTYEAITDAIKLIYEYTDKNAWNNMQISDIVNTPGIEKTKNELIEMAKAGELSPETISGYANLNNAISSSELFLENGQTAAKAFCNEIYACVDAKEDLSNAPVANSSEAFSISEGQSKSIDDFQSKISSLQSSLEKLNSGKLTDSDFVDLIQQFPELANNSRNLGTAIQTLGQSLKDDLLASLGETPTALTDSIESMADKLYDATGGVETLGEAISNLQESQNMMDSLNENIANNGTITMDMINTILSKYPQMTDILSDYLMNLATQEDVILALQGVYDTDLKNYQRLCVGKQAYDTEFYNSVLAKLPKWVSELANSYGIDLKNFKNLAEAKAKVEEALINASQDLWKRYYDRYYAAAQRTNSSTSESEMIQNEKFAKRALNKQKDGEKILSALDDLSIDMSGIQAPQFSASSGSSGSKSGSKSKKAKESKEEINWADRKLEILGKRLDIIKKKASEIASVFKSQNKLLNDAVQNLKRQIEVQKKAKKTYLEKAGKVKLSSSLKKKVRDGSISISSYDSKTAEKIKEYQEWYDAAKDVDSIITQLTLDIKELKKQKIDNIIDDFDRKKSYQESLIDYRETKIGDTGKTSDYNYLIKKTNTIKENLQKEYNEIKKRFDAMVKAGEIKKYSDDWYEYKELLVNLKVEMEECTESVMEYKKAIMQLRFDKFDKAVETLSNLSSEFSNIQRLLSDNFFDGTALTKDGMANLTLNFQGIANAKKSLETYAKGIAGLKKNLQNGNITQEEYNEKLNEYKTAQKEASLAIKDYQDAIINMAVSSINAETEAMRKLIEEKKEALQAEKDLHDYRNSIAEKEQDIAVLQAKIAELSKSSDRKDIALRLELEADLAEAQKDLSETQYDHDMELKQDALDEELENYEKAQDEKIKQLESNLDAQEKVLNDYLKQVQNNYSSTMTYITSHAAAFSYDLTDFLSDPWDTGMQKAKSYQELIDSIVSDTSLSGGKINTNQSGSSSGGSGSSGSGSSSSNSSSGSGSSNFNPGGFGGTMTNIGMEATTPDNEKVSKVSGDIKYGNSGTKVTVLQKALKTLGFNPGKTDGKYGADTLAAAKSFQKNTTKVDGDKLPADGVIESKTKKKFKLNGFKKGVRDLGRDQLAEVNEEGQEVIFRPNEGVLFPLQKHDTVLNAGQTDNLIKNSKIDIASVLQSMPKIESKTSAPAITQNIDASIHVTGVTRDEINKFIEKSHKDSMRTIAKTMTRGSRNLIV